MSIIPKRIVTLGIMAVAAVAGRGVGINPQHPPPRDAAAPGGESDEPVPFSA
jgi:hypothetical protein